MKSEDEIPETRNNELETRNSKRWRRQVMLFAPLLIWTCVIFLLSSSQGSSGRTSLIIRPILEFLFPAASNETLLFYHGIIRKGAHLTEYAVLGFLACRAFRALVGSGWNYVLLSASLVFLVACLDEFNQSYNPLRTGSPYDVLIDVTGGLLAILVYVFVSWRRSEKKNRDEEGEGETGG